MFYEKIRLISQQYVKKIWDFEGNVRSESVTKFFNKDFKSIFEASIKPEENFEITRGHKKLFLAMAIEYTIEKEFGTKKTCWTIHTDNGAINESKEGDQRKRLWNPYWMKILKMKH